ncbi:DUF4411 family protein [Erwinia tracheiphila]|uniref:Twitching motility protein PilT n=1 Tax=Erwinia tracheiphila TaxID=65700 RepID=A0A0M2KJ08_9GAMM|nr:DUF4411 family protein [Erwinia tracheiphila]EOS94743.1 hypothetical protein ETR_12233 [Erwinia tracheiphila PSU-1]KKF36981.1 twitching motility protein PilT [Erwinia tracheiphila]UIA88329.1 DUF4411 family protein [Erwinia tracheiphila]UIA96250.1 DUF4411 family protein [Erwinia tracheiphila]
MNYIIDSNIFIEAQNTYYCLGICPGFWDFLSERFITGELISIRHVYDEVAHKEDAIYEWISVRKHFFGSVDDVDTQKNFALIANYVQTEYESRKKNNQNVPSFLSVADPWLVAKAKTLSATVVTHEVRAGAGSSKPKIPDICDKFGVNFIKTNELLRSLQIRFIQETK